MFSDLLSIKKEAKQLLKYFANLLFLRNQKYEFTKS